MWGHMFIAIILFMRIITPGELHILLIRILIDLNSKEYIVVFANFFFHIPFIPQMPIVFTISIELLFQDLISPFSLFVVCVWC